MISWIVSRSVTGDPRNHTNSREQETDGDPSSLTQSLLWVGFVFCAKGRDVRPMKREGPIDPSPSVMVEALLVMVALQR